MFGDWRPRRSDAPCRRPPARAAPRRARAPAGAASCPERLHCQRPPAPAPPRARRRAAARPAAPRRSGRRAGRRARRSAPPGPRAPRPGRSPVPPPVDPLTNGGRAPVGPGSGVECGTRAGARSGGWRGGLCARDGGATSAKCQKAEVSGGPARMPLTGSFVLPSRPRWRPSRPSASRCASANESGGSGAHSARPRRLLPATSAARAACSRALPCSRACRERPPPPGLASMPAAPPRSCC